MICLKMRLSLSFAARYGIHAGELTRFIFALNKYLPTRSPERPCCQ